MHILKEPLLGFLILGAAMFALFQLGQSGSADGPGPSQQILVSHGDVNALSQAFGKAWQRPPTSTELDQLIDNHVRDEIFYREALAAGLDRDDPLIKRHLRRKLEFVLTGLADPLPPTDAELQTFLQANDETYRLPATYSLTQVWLESEAFHEADAILQRLRSGAIEADSLERGAMVPAAFRGQGTREIERVMGQEFAASLAGLPVGEWHGPIRSGLGLHLVRISRRVDSRIPALSEVRDTVVRDWSAERRHAMDEALFTTLRQRYTITIERPPEMKDVDAPEVGIAVTQSSQ